MFLQRQFMFMLRCGLHLALADELCFSGPCVYAFGVRAGKLEQFAHLGKRPNYASWKKQMIAKFPEQILEVPPAAMYVFLLTFRIIISYTHYLMMNRSAQCVSGI